MTLLLSFKAQSAVQSQSHSDTDGSSAAEHWGQTITTRRLPTHDVQYFNSGLEVFIQSGALDNLDTNQYIKIVEKRQKHKRKVRQKKLSKSTKK